MVEGTERLPDGSIRITDLADPTPSAPQRAALEYAASVDASLQADDVLELAARRTRLDDFGPDDFRPRLDVWLRSADADSGLNPLGRLIVQRNAVRALANRLRVEDLVSRHPEILEVEVRAPIIILGLPRSGTTHLVNVISQDPQLRSLPYWESLEPLPAAGEAAPPGGEDPRLTRCRRDAAAQAELAPLLRSMHHMTPEHVHEEIELQELDFGTFILEWNAVVPDWRDHYLALDLTSSYRYLRKVLQVLQWQRGPNRWVLKSPQHLEQIGPLLATFPDATVAMTHRDPAAVIASAVTMLAYGDRVRRNHVDCDAVVSYWVDRVELLLRACVRDRDVIPEEQAIDVLFHDFMRDDVAMVARVYERAGLPMSNETRTTLSRYVSTHPRGGQGTIHYDLDADFGVAPDDLRARFSFYFDRFPIVAGA